MKSLRKIWFYLFSILIFGIILGSSSDSHAQTDVVLPETTQAILDNIWVLIAAILVIFMNAGFAMVESGFCREKNATNILAKNLIVFALATLAFWAVGYSLMFGLGNLFIGVGGFFLTGESATYGLDGMTLAIPTHFLFQAAFAGTAATIVSGAVAERVRFISFILFSIVLSGLIYPVVGHWAWGGGWLVQLGFIDFAGSTVVHSVGGWAALVGAIALGPRLGKYQGGAPRALPGHNMSTAMLGGFILWIGWFGFNPGSVLAATIQVPYVALTTNLSAAAAALVATLLSWFRFGRPDLSMSINGVLAGLVAITAGCANVAPWAAVVIGAIAGMIVVYSVALIDQMGIDDPVGALSVHLVCGVWGTLAVGVFDFDQAGLVQFITQFIGVIAVGLFTVIASIVGWYCLGLLVGLRVSNNQELAGLDMSEHGIEAYAGFLKVADAE
ncbi:MAG: ammonium transporter [Cyanobacteria bacterium P01_D01_bin.44]